MCHIRIHGEECYFCRLEVSIQEYATLPIDGALRSVHESCLAEHEAASYEEALEESRLSHYSFAA